MCHPPASTHIHSQWRAGSSKKKGDVFQCFRYIFSEQMRAGSLTQGYLNPNSALFKQYHMSPRYSPSTASQHSFRQMDLSAKRDHHTQPAHWKATLSITIESASGVHWGHAVVLDVLSCVTFSPN